MKRIFYVASVAILAVFAASCSLERIPEGSTVQKPYESFKDANFNREGLHSILRSAESMSNLWLCDAQTDIYSVTRLEGGGTLALDNWDPVHMVGAGDYYYQNYYTLNMQANHLIMRMLEAIDTPDLFLPNEKELAKQYVAEARIAKALSVYRLMLRYSKPYDKATASTTSGICLIKSYKEQTEYVPRAKQDESYAYALEMLQLAIADMPETTVSGTASEYLTKDYAYALQARIYLQMGEWQKARDAVNMFIDKYPLTDLSDLTSTADKNRAVARIYTTGSTENMVRMYADNNLGTFGDPLGKASWYNLTDGGRVQVFEPTHIPAQWVVDLYDDDDTRKNVYIGRESYNYEVPDVYMVLKFAGDPEYDTNKAETARRNAVSLFNIAEAYLIRAEASAQLADYPAAGQDLMALNEARGVARMYSDPSKLLEEVRNERLREMIGEGMRINDMQRAGLDLKRSAPQASMQANIVTHIQEVPADSKYWVWEIPLNDRLVNPHIKNDTNW